MKPCSSDLCTCPSPPQRVNLNTSLKTERKFNCIKYKKQKNNCAFTLWWGSIFRSIGGIMLTASCRLMLPCEDKQKECQSLHFFTNFLTCFGVFYPLPLVTQMWSFGLWLTHRLCLADQKLVELLQQGRLPYDLPAHVGVPGLLIRVPEEHSPQSGFNLNQCIFLVLGKTRYITSWEAVELRSSDHRFRAPEYPWNIFPSDNEGSPWHGWKKEIGSIYIRDLICSPYRCN